MCLICKRLQGHQMDLEYTYIDSTYKIHREPVHRTANRMEDKAFANCREVIREIHFSSETLQRSPKRVKFCDELFPYPIVQMYSMFPRLGAVYHYLICQVMEFLPAIPSHTTCTYSRAGAKETGKQNRRLPRNTNSNSPICKQKLRPRFHFDNW